MSYIDQLYKTNHAVQNLSLLHEVSRRIVGLTDEMEIAHHTADVIADHYGYNFTVKISLDPENVHLPDPMCGSEIRVPLSEGDEIIGAIYLECVKQDAFPDDDNLLVEVLGGIVSSAIMYARRHRQLQDKISQLQAVRETALDIIVNLDLLTLFRRVVLRARDLVHAKGAELGLVDETGAGIRIQITENPWDDIQGVLIPISKGVAGQVLATGGPVSVPDYNSWEHRFRDELTRPFKAVAGIPLKLKDRVIGTLIVLDDHPDRLFSDEDIQTLELLAPNIAFAIQNAQLYLELQERIAAQKEAERLLIQSEKMAIAGRLTASIAHEINNPLQALQNVLYLAGHSKFPIQERNRYLELARSELDRLVALVQRMLDFYRPGIRDRCSTDINGLIQHVIDLLQPQLADGKIEVHTSFDPGAPGIYVVPGQIQQVLLNLMLNAMEAMPEGGDIYITTSTCNLLQVVDGKPQKKNIPHGVEIIVRDTGAGISAEDGEQIFDPFFSTKSDGTGLGLSISYSIIEAHGGRLSIINENHSGACFRIVLPEEQGV